MGRKLNEPVIGAEVASDGLPDPPVDVSAECIPSLWIELLHPVGQTDVPLLDDVQHLREFAPVGVPSGHTDHKAEVAVDQLLVSPATCPLCLPVWSVSSYPGLNLSC